MLVRLKGAVKLRDGADAKYIVGADYMACCSLNGESDYEITVPRGLITDLASVPWFARWLVSRVGPHLEAAIIHDYLYIAWQDLGSAPPDPKDRAFADKFLREALKAANVWWFRRWAIYRSVRLFGWRSYASREEQRYLDLDDPEVVAQFPHSIGNVVDARAS